MNVARCERYFHRIKKWSETDWACAMAGETGEACNLIKKRRSGEKISASEVGKELADMVIYADLLATKLGLSLGQCVQLKFNEVSKRKESYLRL
jgi:NTP pyrophosphatase (non-canonical NTP hydrolase)